MKFYKPRGQGQAVINTFCSCPSQTLSVIRYCNCVNLILHCDAENQRLYSNIETNCKSDCNMWNESQASATSLRVSLSQSYLYTHVYVFKLSFVYLGTLMDKFKLIDGLQIHCMNEVFIVSQIHPTCCRILE